MKFYKLIKSIDYVNYPSYKELVKISDSVSNSVIAFRDMLISIAVGVLFEVAPLSTCILSCLAEKFPNKVMKAITEYKNSSAILSIIIATIVFLIFRFVRFVILRWGSNKNTKQKRDLLVHEFYRVSIPQLIEIKSIIEQMREEPSGEDRKKTLLLLQAKHEMCDLYGNLFEMKIIEKDKTGMQTDDSHILSSRIGKSAYIAFLEEMLELLEIIYEELSKSGNSNVKKDMDDIRSLINISGGFKINEIECQLKKIKSKINANK